MKPANSISAEDFKALTAGATKGRVLPGHTQGKMNSTEAKFYRDCIEPLVATGEIVWWKFESITLTIAVPRKAKTSRWTADFAVLYADGSQVMFDVKGGRPRDEQAQHIKIKCASEQYPQYRFVIAKRQDGQWKETEV